jgi:hypothetical protein
MYGTSTLPVVSIATSIEDNDFDITKKRPSGLAHLEADMNTIMNVVELLGRVTKAQRTTKKAHTIKKHHTKKIVSFACNSDGDVKCLVKEFHREFRTTDCQELWWTEEEMLLIRQEYKNIVRFLRQDQEYLWALKIMYSANNGNVSDHDIEGACQILAESAEARGLERKVASISRELLNEHRHATLAASNLSTNASIARRRSRMLSRLGGEFASALAEFDAQEAAVVYFC